MRTKKIRIVQVAKDQFSIEIKGWLFWNPVKVSIKRDKTWADPYSDRVLVRRLFSTREAAEDFIKYNIGRPVVTEMEVLAHA